MKNLGELKAMKEDKLNKTIDKRIKEEFKKADKKVKNKAKINLVYDKKKDEWKVVDVNRNYEFQDAIMGGMLTYQAQQSMAPKQ